MIKPEVKEVQIITIQQRNQVLQYLFFLRFHFERTEKSEARVKIEKIIFQFYMMKKRIRDIQATVFNKNKEEQYYNYSHNDLNNPNPDFFQTQSHHKDSKNMKLDNQLSNTFLHL